MSYIRGWFWGDVMMRLLWYCLKYKILHFCRNEINQNVALLVNVYIYLIKHHTCFTLLPNYLKECTEISFTSCFLPQSLRKFFSLYNELWVKQTWLYFYKVSFYWQLPSDKELEFYWLKNTQYWLVAFVMESILSLEQF